LGRRPPLSPPLELHSAFFHLYDLSRADTDYILGTFPVTRKNEERDFGEFRTRRVVLEEYGRMAQRMGTG